MKKLSYITALLAATALTSAPHPAPPRAASGQRATRIGPSREGALRIRRAGPLRDPPGLPPVEEPEPSLSVLVEILAVQDDGTRTGSVADADIGFGLCE